jgi:putative phosphoesterase
MDLILCAGDLIDFGDDSNGVVRRISSMAIPCVAGNHDKRAVQNPVHRSEQLDRGMKVEILDAETIEFLRQLPPVLIFEWEQTTVMLAHANPWGADNQYVQPTSPLPLFQRVIREAKTDIVILGHTHQPMCVHIKGTMIVNPGSVSNNYTLPFGTCGILDLPERQFHVINLETGDLIDEYPILRND